MSDSIPSPIAVGKPSRLLATVSMSMGSPMVMTGVIISLILVLAAIFAPLIAPYSPDEINYRVMLNAPSAAHFFGTDDLGRDIFSRLLYGARLSLGVGCMAVLLAVAVGVPVGLISGYVGGFVDEVVMRVLDSIIALPPLVMALTISAVLGSGLVNATIAIAVVTIPTYARLIRGQVLSVKNNDYVLAALSVGLPSHRVLFRHILPNVISPIIVQASLGVGFAIILESSLSFIGLGAQPPTSTWGSMVQTGFQYLDIAPWFVLAPAFAIFFAVLSVNLLAEGLSQTIGETQNRRA